MKEFVAVSLVLSVVSLVEAGRDIPVSVQLYNDLFRPPPTPVIQSRARILTKYIEQKLDHFDDTNTQTFKMRYMENKEFWVEGGPIFILVGGEWEINEGGIKGGHFHDMAREHHAMLYYTEHRFYGKTKPTSDLSRENLKYLNVKQALADLAHFIRSQKETVPGMKNSKVILMGGSYAATMVVWFKFLYPELIVGGWASSAPLYAKIDFLEYKEVVGQAFKELGGAKCYNRIQNGIATMEEMFVNKRGAEVKALLKICDNFDEENDLDLWTLFSSISNLFSGIAQYQRSGDIPYYCDYLMSHEDDLTGIVKFIAWNLGKTENCFDFTYKDMLSYYLDTTYNAGNSRSWFYQTCNEYGWYQSSKSKEQPFGSKFPAILYTNLCYDVYGKTYTDSGISANVAKTNKDFLGFDIQVENIYQTHGALDPWHPMGHGETQGATLLPQTSHCADFDPISSSDTTEMRASKERVAELFREWLS